MNRFRQLVCALVLGLAFAPSRAEAEPPGSGKDDAKAERKQEKAAEKELAADLRDARRATNAGMRARRRATNARKRASRVVAGTMTTIAG
jgi:hypothetical protein